jgi:muramoyltetrapeptide carboxypeptidase
MTSRRTMLAGAGASLLTGCVNVRHYSLYSRPLHLVGAQRLPIIWPKPLKLGDTVALISPSGLTDEEQVQKAERNVQSLGYSAVRMPNVLAKRGNAAGTISQRISDLHEALRDPAIHALWPVRGGSGGSQILPFIDYDLVRAARKPIIGFSDITSLHLAVQAQAGLVSFHTIDSGSTFQPYSVDYINRLLQTPHEDLQQLPFEMKASLEQDARGLAGAQPDGSIKVEPHFAPVIFRSGVAQGRLIGGNLAVLAGLVGTPYMPSTDDAILFLEEISEVPYRIDRMLTQLAQAGHFKNLRGLMFGVFVRCDPKPEDASLSMIDTLRDFANRLSVPCAYGFPTGHIRHQMAMPLGAVARVDFDQRSVQLLGV